MNIRFLVVILSVALLSAGCATTASKEKAAAEKKIKKYSADLNGDGKAEIVEAQDLLDTESATVVAAKKQLKGKVQEVIDTFKVPGKISRLEIVELYLDSSKQIALIFKDNNDVFHVAIYRLLNDKFSQMFAGDSKYGVDMQFKGAVPRIRIARPPLGGKVSPNLVPEWDDWVWTGDKFIKDQI